VIEIFSKDKVNYIFVKKSVETKCNVNNSDVRIELNYAIDTFKYIVIKIVWH